MAQHQTYDERRQQILSGALHAFSEKGYLGTSNKDIAQAAGINSAALIYHYFENKEALFQAVIEENLPPVHLADQMAFFQAQPVYDALMTIGTAVVEAMTQPQTLTLLRLLLAEALREPEVARAIYQGGPAHILAFLYDYFGQLMQTGVLKEADLGATVRTFIGPLMAYVISSKLLNFPDEKTPDATVMVETAVHIFLAGVRIDNVLRDA
ncbi:MAG: TetR/AcrR family transcriptional regulator [Caldilineaceae bacterium]|nr:TetR/AcrR family transcriptional regulator [Caldilineaceae bacterium]